MQEFNCYGNPITRIENLPKELQRFDCRSNQITRIENLPNSLQRFYCGTNQITRIENLPNSLQLFYYNDNPIEFVDNVEFNKIKFTLKGYQAIKRIQRRNKRQFKIKNESIIIIQNECWNWLWKAKCKDNTYGIVVRIGMTNCDLGNFLYPNHFIL